MKFKVAFASIVVASLAVPTIGYTQGAAINTSRSNIKHPSLVDPKDPASVQACSDAKGKVVTQEGKAICSVPDPSSADAKSGISDQGAAGNLSYKK